METLNLELLLDDIEALSISQRGFYQECCILVLEKATHQPGTPLKVTGENSQTILLTWNKFHRKTGLREPRDLTELGALAIAIWLVTRSTNFNVLQQSVIGTGFDYWLTYKPEHDFYDPDNFLNARLEVSGILKGESSDIQRRLKQKIRQVGVSDSLNIPAAIVIIEFGLPQALMYIK